MKRFAITLCLFIGSLAGSLSAVPAQVTIIGHAEVDSTGILTQKGLERAGALAAYFAYSPDLITYGAPVSIFAARPTPAVAPYPLTENNQTCIQTVVPTGVLLKLPIHSGYTDFEEDELAAFVLNNPRYNGKNVLICWNNVRIQALAQAFGVTTAPIFPVATPNRVVVHNDITWIITYTPTIKLTSLFQELLYGDTKEPI